LSETGNRNKLPSNSEHAHFTCKTCGPSNVEVEVFRCVDKHVQVSVLLGKGGKKENPFLG